MMMSTKMIKITYWVLTGILVLFSLFDAYGGLTHMKQGVAGVTHLGYPVYLLDISGTAKLIGAVCLIQTRFSTIKEWAYAGFILSYIFALWSHLHAGDPVAMIMMPVIFMAYTFLTYYFWKRFQPL